MHDKMPPIHPGEILNEDFMKPYGMSEHWLAEAIQVEPSVIQALVQGRHAVTDDMATGLARYFGTTARFWLNSQARYERELAEDEGAP